MLSSMTLMHEHMRLDLSGEKGNIDCLLDEYHNIRDELLILSKQGFSRIVDLSCRGMGRDYIYLDSMMKDTGIEILISTGFYKEPFLPEIAYEADEKTIAEMFISDIRTGCEGSLKKAALIGEIGSSLNIMTQTEKKIFNAAAKAHGETGVPIFTHTTLGTLGLEQTHLLKSLDVDPGKVVIGHLDLANNLDLIFSVLDEGVYVEFDTIGKTKYLPDEVRADFIAECCRKGYSKQLLLSMDITRRSHLLRNGGPGYAYLIDSFLPLLYKNGVGESEINTILVYNPQQLLGA